MKSEKSGQQLDFGENLIGGVPKVEIEKQPAKEEIAARARLNFKLMSAAVSDKEPRNWQKKWKDDEENRLAGGQK